MTETMTIPYLVIWLTDNDMKTRQETPIDLELYVDDLAGERVDAILGALSKEFKVGEDRISLINICRL